MPRDRSGGRETTAQDTRRPGFLRGVFRLQDPSSISALAEQVASLTAHNAALLARLDAFEALLVDIHRAATKRRDDPRFLSWSDAGARFGGISADAAKRRIDRELKRPDGFRLRVARGLGVNRADFEQYLDSLEQRRKPVCEYLRAARERMER